MIRTIFSGNKRHLPHPVFVIVHGDGYGYDYKYTSYSTRAERARAEPHFVEDMMDGPRNPRSQAIPMPIYRINVYPKRRGLP